MNVILTIDYNRYALSLEEAGKIMAILGKAKSVSSKYDDEAGHSYYQYEPRGPHITIEQPTLEIRN